jgi:hypothetical protein
LTEEPKPEEQPVEEPFVAPADELGEGERPTA